MAPDKIYVNQDMIYSQMLDVVDDICYIRKDALLDKLNLAIKLRDDGNPNSDGVQTIRAMINYIESL